EPFSNHGTHAQRMNFFDRSLLPKLVQRVVFAAGLLTLFSGHLSDLQAQEGKTVKSVDVQYVGSPTVSKDRILSRTTTRVGDPLSLSQVDEDVKNLYESGDVEKVKVLADNVSGGVALIFVVQTRAVYGGARFTGNTIISTSRLEKKIDMRVNRPIDEEALKTARQDMQDVYRKKGFAEATVSYRIGAPTAEGYSFVTFVINEGTQGVLRNVEFVGNTAFPEARLKEVMEQKEKGIKSLLGDGGATDAETLAIDVRAIEDFYRDEGFLNAKVVNVSRVRVDSKHVDVVMTIDEGRTYEVASLKINGVNALSMQDDILPYLRTKAGQKFAGSDLKADVKLISDQYGRNGYIESRVIPQLEDAGNGAVRVVLTVVEGQAFSIGQIHIEGNTKTKDHVIRRELPLEPGQPFDTTLTPVAQRRLENMNYFEVVDFIPLDTSYTNVKDLVIRVTEKATGSVNFGAGFSSIDSLTGFFEITQSNFDLFDWPSLSGGGQRFRLSARAGTERQDYAISITEPWFMGHRVALTTEGYYKDLEFLSDQFDQKNIGGAISLRKSLGEFTYGSIEYRGERIEINPVANASQAFRNEAGQFFKSSVTVSATRDTRDNLFLPRKGNKVSAGFEFAGLGGDVDDTIFNVEGSQYFSLPYDAILSFRGRFQYSSNGDHIFTRHFLGGANNLRGFDFRDVGPRDPVSRETLGGKQAWFGSVEVTVPVIEKIRGALFYDVGEVTDGPMGSVGGGVNSNWGIGVRMFILGNAPVRLDYAFPVQADRFNDEGGRFQFTMGANF
ncbi:MAG: outer membrane protein assembly factor BamA, partial [Verrucomicrobiota bacterium]